MTESPPGAMLNRVVRLRIHPVKGARGSDVDTLHFEAMGPRFDRRWMVVRPDGSFVTQRDTPRLATIRPTVADGALTLVAPEAPALRLPLTPRGERLQATVWSSVMDVSTVSATADAWLSSVLGGPHRLVFMGDEDVRNTDPDYAEGHRVSFADGYPALLVSQGSVDKLARRVGREIPVERFRPNIVVSGDRPHEEDFWQEFTIGAVRFRGVKLCARCKVTTTDQETGARDPDREPLRTLARYRRIESLVYFGVNTVHLATGPVSLGDPVEVHERGIVRGAI